MFKTCKDSLGEYGHFGFRAVDSFIDCWGSGPFEIEVRGKKILFEDSDRFGPMTLTKGGDPREKQPSEKDPFWDAHALWVKQGRQVVDGVAVYDPLQAAARAAASWEGDGDV